MTPAIPTDPLHVIEQKVPEHLLAARICLSCGAKTDSRGLLPCGH